MALLPKVKLKAVLSSPATSSTVPALMSPRSMAPSNWTWRLTTLPRRSLALPTAQQCAVVERHHQLIHPGPDQHSWLRWCGAGRKPPTRALSTAGSHWAGHQSLLALVRLGQLVPLARPARPARQALRALLVLLVWTALVLAPTTFGQHRPVQPIPAREMLALTTPRSARRPRSISARRPSPAT